MGGHKSYEDSIKAVYKGLVLLAVVTLIEVGLSLFGKKFIGEGSWLIGIIALGLIALSVYKAYFIVYEFMHMSSEVKGLRLSVILPTLLLVWGIIAFFYEGNAWKENRETIYERNAVESPNSVKVIK